MREFSQRMEITGEQSRRVVEALLNGFPESSLLRQMVAFNLNEDLMQIAGGTSTREIVFNLVSWANANGRLGELLDAARAENPHNPQIHAIAAELQLPEEDEGRLKLGFSSSGRSGKVAAERSHRSLLISEENVNQILQYKIDATCAVVMHDYRLARLATLARIVDFLAIGVPVLYFVPRFAARGTGLYATVELVWEGTAALLLVLGVWKICMAWDERIRKHFLLLRRNQALRTEAERLIATLDRVTPDRFHLFVERARELEADDAEMLAGFSKSEEQRIYRDALRQDNPNAKEVFCPHCGSPTIVGFKPGSCPRCGGTPAVDA